MACGGFSIGWGSEMLDENSAGNGLSLAGSMRLLIIGHGRHGKDSTMQDSENTG